MNKSLEDKYLKLKEYFKKLENVVLAYSGGVDSTLLMKVGVESIGDKLLSITINTPYIPDWELEEAIELTKKIGANHKIIHLNIPDSIKNNPDNRCYLCKHKLFKKLLEEAKNEGGKHLIEGTNADDLNDYRPGLKALEELNVLSPLKECGFSKSDIRELSKELGLPTWDKPAYACLLTRLPFNTEIKLSHLKQIEECEKYLFSKGFRAARVRHHYTVARIEIPKENISDFFKDGVNEEVANFFKKNGFTYICLDIEGYRTGSLNAEIKKL